LTVRPSHFEYFPSQANWREDRAAMKQVCRPCHGRTWIKAHFDTLDKVVVEYNEAYYQPALARLNKLYQMDLLSENRWFDEALEFEFYELWHHEGRRARMGAAMMGPDYTWWHGFYELKNRYNRFMAESARLIRAGREAYQYPNFPVRK
jgi:hypothetical protein